MSTTGNGVLFKAVLLVYVPNSEHQKNQELVILGSVGVQLMLLTMSLVYDFHFLALLFSVMKNH